MDRRLPVLLAFAVGLAILVVVILVARGGDDGDDGAEPAAEKPEVVVPDGPPPEELAIEDIEVGDGAEAQAGDQVTVQYVGVDAETGEEFDSSWERPEPFSFTLGGGEVIEGWDEGVVGMREGGRRQLVIPPDLAYGRQGSPPAIGPDATLVFVVDLVSVG
jgi:peptidylprolyl isomerase